MFDINELKFDEKGLIPAVVVDATTKKVLTVAYMNKESLAISMEKGLTCFWSRSRNELWLKGETSGNYQHVVSITADCDKDALVVVVEKDGPACHLGTDSCFNEVVSVIDPFVTNALAGVLSCICFATGRMYHNSVSGINTDMTGIIIVTKKDDVSRLHILLLNNSSEFSIPLCIFSVYVISGVL